jgi:nucleotide-binding universal stress UspA family protein
VVRDEDGQLGNVVLAEAEKGYDLLVIGTTGQRGGSKGPTFTEVADDVIQEAPCPVLIVRVPSSDGDRDADGADGAESMELRHVLLPVFGGESDRYAAEVAFGLARDRDTVVNVVHIVRGGERRARLSDDEAVQSAVEVGEDLLGQTAELGHTLGATVHTDVVVADHEDEAIVEQAGNDTDLIVLASNRAAGSRRAFLGHHVDYVLRHADCPVVVVSSP